MLNMRLCKHTSDRTDCRHNACRLVLRSRPHCVVVLPCRLRPHLCPLRPPPSALWFPYLPLPMPRFVRQYLDLVRQPAPARLPETTRAGERAQLTLQTPRPSDRGLGPSSPRARRQQVECDPARDDVQIHGVACEPLLFPLRQVEEQLREGELVAEPGREDLKACASDGKSNHMNRAGGPKPSSLAQGPLPRGAQNGR